MFLPQTQRVLVLFASYPTVPRDQGTSQGGPCLLLWPIAGSSVAFYLVVHVLVDSRNRDAAFHTAS